MILTLLFTPPEASPPPPALTAEKPDDSQEEFDLLFDSPGEGPVDNAPPPLSDTDLAIFDPCAKEGAILPHISCCCLGPHQGHPYISHVTIVFNTCLYFKATPQIIESYKSINSHNSMQFQLLASRGGM